MINENLSPPEADERFDSFHDSNVDEAEGLVLEDILDNDNSDLVTMEELPGGLDTNRKFGEIWWLHIKEGLDSDSFNEQVNKKVVDMYEPDPDYGRE